MSTPAKSSLMVKIFLTASEPEGRARSPLKASFDGARDGGAFDRSKKRLKAISVDVVYDNRCNREIRFT